MRLYKDLKHILDAKMLKVQKSVQHSNNKLKNIGENKNA